jgi:site-specific DNA-methyltransferase (adenine-specific)
MIAAMKCNRNSIGIEVDEEYCSIAANRLRDENQNLFSSAKLEFPDFTAAPEKALLVREGVVHYSLTSKKTKKAERKGEN